MLIRNAAQADYPEILAITEAAFAEQEFSNQTETAIIQALLHDDALAVSLVAEIDNIIVGHAAFSVVSISEHDYGWYGLGPVSVLPQFQKQGIGRALIDSGLQALKREKATGCVVLGDPAYYRRFGFKQSADLIFDGAPPEYFMAVSFTGSIPAGLVAYHPAFYLKSANTA